MQIVPLMVATIMYIYVVCFSVVIATVSATLEVFSDPDHNASVK